MGVVSKWGWRREGERCGGREHGPVPTALGSAVVATVLLTYSSCHRHMCSGSAIRASASQSSPGSSRTHSADPNLLSSRVAVP